MDRLCKLITPHSRQLFNTMWQQRVFSNIKSSFKPSEIVSVIDFAANYSTFHQNEIQNAQWANDQVILFPIVTWYRCPVCPSEAPPVREYLIFLSDDIKHDWWVPSTVQKSWPFCRHQLRRSGLMGYAGAPFLWQPSWQNRFWWSIWGDKMFSSSSGTCWALCYLQCGRPVRLFQQ